MILLEKGLTRRRRGNNNPADSTALLGTSDLFEIKYRKALSAASGVERLAFALVPKEIVKSIVLTLDPFSRFDSGKAMITPANRVRTKWSSQQPRKGFGGFTSTQTTNYHTSGLVCGPRTIGPTQTTPINRLALTNAFGDYGRMRDTITSTRDARSGFGEMERFTFSQSSPPVTVATSDYSAVYSYFAGCGIPQGIEITQRAIRSTTGPYARIPSADVFTLRDSEITTLMGLMQTNALKMLPGIIPDARRYSLFRNVAELKDLPRSVTNLRESLYNLGHLFASTGRSPKTFGLYASVLDIPKEWVSYHFGWKQLYKDVLDLLRFTEKVNKEINFLLTRSARPTTYRSRRTFPGTVSGTPVFVDYPTSSVKESPTYKTVVSRDHEVRLIVNATFDFPTTGRPEFKEALFLKKLGLNPTVTDLYNLVPWSWLVDWLTGLGNYIEAVDVINQDRSLFNWGFVVGQTKGTITTVEQFTSTSRRSVQVLPAAAKEQLLKTKHTHTSVASFQLEIRKNLATMGSVHVTSDVNTLSAYQASILGAILLNRSFKTGRQVDH